MYRSADLTKWEDPVQDYRHGLSGPSRRKDTRMIQRAFGMLKGNITRFRLKP